MHRLRKKIEPSGVRIITVRGLGYCLEKAAPAPAAAPVAGETAATQATPSATAAATAAPAPGAMPASHYFK